MVNFNLEGFDDFAGYGGGTIEKFLQTFGVFAMFIVVIIVMGILTLWVFSSLGIMNQAKKKNIPNPWLAFIPVGRSYILGKLGFEVYDSENTNATTFMWVTFILGAASFVLSGSNSDLKTLIYYASVFFETWAFYNIFKKENPKNAIIFTIFTALTSTLLGGLFLYLMKQESDKEFKTEVNYETKKEEPKEKVEEVLEKENKTKKEKTATKETFKYCSNCGTKLKKEAKFCPECGNKVN